MLLGVAKINRKQFLKPNLTSLVLISVSRLRNSLATPASNSFGPLSKKTSTSVTSSIISPKNTSNRLVGGATNRRMPSTKSTRDRQKSGSDLPDCQMLLKTVRPTTTLGYISAGEKRTTNRFTTATTTTTKRTLPNMRRHFW